jgi:sugar phosphate isomerase/epimerase
MANLISVSSAPVAGFGNKEYYDLSGTIEVLKTILSESVVDGFELQLEPEWDAENAPITDSDWSDWTKTPKHTVEEIIDLVKKERLPILSVHASRDIGSYLCSDKKRDFEKGIRTIHESLQITESLGAKVCVFHLWDTWKTGFDLYNISKMFAHLADQYPRVKASVENIPTHLKNRTPFMLVKCFDYLTLDLRWAAMYDELDAFKSIVGSVVNVHLRGSLKDTKWVLERSNFGFYEALRRIRKEWGYSGLLTLEPEGRIDSSEFENFLHAMRSLKR